MSILKMVSLVLCAALLLPLGAWADGERGTMAEEDEYSVREAASPGAEHFVGGSHGLLLLLLLLACGGGAAACFCH